MEPALCRDQLLWRSSSVDSLTFSAFVPELTSRSRQTAWRLLAWTGPLGQDVSWYTIILYPAYVTPRKNKHKRYIEELRLFLQIMYLVHLNFTLFFFHVAKNEKNAPPMAFSMLSIMYHRSILQVIGHKNNLCMCQLQGV